MRGQTGEGQALSSTSMRLILYRLFLTIVACTHTHTALAMYVFFTVYNIILYVMFQIEEGIVFTVEFAEDFPVENHQQVPVTVYDYYDPGIYIL